MESLLGLPWALGCLLGPPFGLHWGHLWAYFGLLGASWGPLLGLLGAPRGSKIENVSFTKQNPGSEPKMLIFPNISGGTDKDC